MRTLYYYIDESFREFTGTWHCNVGGAIVAAETVVDAEIALQGVIHEVCTEHKLPDLSRTEFKCANFFSAAPDDVKLLMCQRLTERIAALGIKFLVSHAWIRKQGMVPVIQPASQQIQLLAAVNLGVFLADLTEKNVVQMLVDLGLSDGFRPIYQIHAGARSIIPQLKALGFKDEDITVPNFRNLPAPAFLQSQDSRLLQYSDLVIGLLLGEAANQLTPFKARLIDTLAPIRQHIELQSIEWNAE